MSKKRYLMNRISQFISIEHPNFLSVDFVRGFNIFLLHYLEFVLIYIFYISSYFTVTDDSAESTLGSYDGGDGRASADPRYLPAWHTASSECRPFSLFLPTDVISFVAARGYFRQSRDGELDPWNRDNNGSFRIVRAGNCTTLFLFLNDIILPLED